MDNILKSIPSNLKKNSNKVEIKNKLTFGDINIRNLKVNSNFNHLIFDNLHGTNINIHPIKTSGLFNIFQFNNYNKNFSFKVNHFHNVKENYTKTNNFFEKVKDLEKQMENYTTGLHIKCFKNLTLENFDVTSNQLGEQIIYFKNCEINGDLSINLAGRSMVIFDNCSVGGVIKFHLSVKLKPIIITRKEEKSVIVKNENVNGESNNSYETFTTSKNHVSNNSNSMIIVGLVMVAVVSGIFFLGGNIKNNQLKDFK